jgi:hypothetical protein
MVLYKYAHYFTTSNHAAFDTIGEPGTPTQWSGIYRCEGCGKAITSIAGNTLPPQNHHQHTAMQGRIRWRLAASHE